MEQLSGSGDLLEHKWSTAHIGHASAHGYMHEIQLVLAKTSLCVLKVQESMVSVYRHKIPTRKSWDFTTDMKVNTSNHE